MFNKSMISNNNAAVACMHIIHMIKMVRPTNKNCFMEYVLLLFYKTQIRSCTFDFVLHIFTVKYFLIFV